MYLKDRLMNRSEQFGSVLFSHYLRKWPGVTLLCPSFQQIAVPRNDEWTRFVCTLAEINESRDDAEELAAQRLAA